MKKKFVTAIVVVLIVGVAVLANRFDPLQARKERLAEEAAQIEAAQAAQKDGAPPPTPPPEPPTPERLAERERAIQANRERGEQFLAENAGREDVIVLASGLQYTITKEGTGPKPTRNSTVEVHYEGTLVDGTVFDSSASRGRPAVFMISNVIPGWIQALEMMPVGSRWKLFVPSELAYGAQSIPPVITPYSTLIFDIELLGIRE